MIVWSLSIGCLFFALHEVAQPGTLRTFGLGLPCPEKRISQVVDLLHQIQEILESGIVPTEELWLKVRQLEKPWGPLIAVCVDELRASGNALLPSLRRLRRLAEENRRALVEGRAKSAQARAQAIGGVAIVPTLGVLLYFMLPGLSGAWREWMVTCAVGVCFALLGGAWMRTIAERARWGGLPQAHSMWPLVLLCAGERTLGALRAGQTPDLAWSAGHRLLYAEARPLADCWGGSLWIPEHTSRSSSIASASVWRAPIAQIMKDASVRLRLAIQASVIEGRPCAERLEAGMDSLWTDIKGAIERELGLIGTRALKPLFICVAPAMLGVMGLAFFFSITSSGGWI